MLRTSLALALALAALASLSACRSKAPEVPQADESVRSVYPLSIAADPLAARLCQAIQELPARAKATCCKRPPGATLGAECTRMLSGALSFHAVGLDPAAVDRCAADLAKSYDGCAWVGPNPPDLPPACEGIVHGLLGEKERCRSSLECGAGLHCQGVGPTDLGACLPPQPAGAVCDTAVDALAGYTRQNLSVEAERPECAGGCVGHRCQAALPAGKACRLDPECGSGARCSAGACVPGRLAAAGGPCLAQSDCPASTRCIAASCQAPRPEGATCREDLECLGACNAGRCGPRC